MPNRESALAGLFENGPVRVGNQGLKRFFPNHLTAPRPPMMETRPLLAWVCLSKFLHQGDCEWLTPCPLGRQSGAMRSFPWSPEPALPLPFSSKVCLLVFATTKERPFYPPYKSVPPSLLYHPIEKTSNKFYQRALNIITFLVIFTSMETISVS